MNELLTVGQKVKTTNNVRVFFRGEIVRIEQVAADMQFDEDIQYEIEYTVKTEMGNKKFRDGDIIAE